MRIIAALIVAVIAFISSVSAQTTQTIPCEPKSIYPGPGFVPTSNCEGWVPANHPLARPPEPLPTPAPTPIPPLSAAAQDILVGIDYPRAGGSYPAINFLSGWALDCKLGSYPPSIRIVETKPDGSLREIPTTNNYNPATERIDVQSAYGGVCPAVYNVPASDGSSLGPNDRFGWSLPISAVTEPGVHTFTIMFAWPAQNHAGSSTVSVTIR